MGDFALYRKNASSPLLIDLEILTTTAFADAVAEVVERMQHEWFAKPRKEEIATSGYGATRRPVLASPMAAAMEMQNP